MGILTEQRLAREAASRPAAAAPATGSTLRAVSNALWYLDTPGAVVRSVVDYGMDGTWNNPLDDATRVSSDDLAEKVGFEHPWAKFAAGTAIGVALDPLTYVAGPLKALTPAGKAAKSLGLIDDAAEIASRKLQTTLKGTPLDQLSGRARRSVEAVGRTSIDDFAEHGSRPLVGQRAAQRTTTLDDVVKNSSDPSVQRNLDAYLTKTKQTYDEIKDLPLSGSFGFGSAVGDPLGAAAGDAAARSFDRIGEAVRWSPVGRAAHQFSNKLVGGLLNPIGQTTATQINTAGKKGAARGAREAGEVAQHLQFAKIPDDVALRTGITDARGLDAQEALDRYIEGVAMTAKDRDLVENTPGLKSIAEYWSNARSKILDESKQAGLNAHQLQHRFGADYRPYMLTTALEREVLNKAGSKGAYFDLVTGDMIARQKSLQMPGGIDQLRYYAKKTDFLGERGINPATGKKWTDNEIADWIHTDVNNPAGEYYATVPGSRAAAYPGQFTPPGKFPPAPNWQGIPHPLPPRYTRGNAMAVSKFLSQLDPKDPVAFGSHPAETIARYVTGRYAAIGTGEALGDSVISRAVQKVAANEPGGGMVSLTDALKKVGLKSQRTASSPLPGGAAARAREAIGKKLGKSPDDVNLSEYSVPASFLDQLTAAQNLVSAPKAQTAFGEFMRENMRAFKTQVLSWPSRITRDWMSASIGNFLVVQDPVALGNSMRHTQSLLDGQYAEAIPYIRSLPLYETAKSDADALKMYLDDLAEAGVLKGMGMVDRDVGDRTGKALLDVLPGSTPLPRPRLFNPQAIKEVVTNPNSLDFYGIKGVSIGNRDRSWAQAGKDFLADPAGELLTAPKAAVRKETTNPFFRKMEQSAEWSDAHTRLSGYNALLSQGVAPKEAARRLKEVHVDYESLTDFEKGVRDFAAPFYTYTVRSGQYAAEQLMTPGSPYYHTLKTLDRLQEDGDDSYLPQSYREKGGFGLDYETFKQAGLPDWLNPGFAPEGMGAVLGGVDVPGMSGLNMIAYKPSGRDGVAGALDSVAASAQATLGNVLSQAAPILRTGAEAAFGRDMHTKRPIGDTPSQWDKVLGAVTQDEDARLPAIAKHALDVAVPGFSRVAGFVGTAFDPRLDLTTSLPQAAFNTVSPVRRHYVSEKQRRQDELSAIDEMLQRVPGRVSFTRTSLPDDVVAQLPPEFQAVYARKKVLESEIRKERSEAKKRAERFGATRSER